MFQDLSPANSQRHCLRRHGRNTATIVDDTEIVDPVALLSSESIAYRRVFTTIVERQKLKYQVVLPARLITRASGGTYGLRVKTP